MAFILTQGKKIQILSSKRKGEKVRQEKLYTFKSFKEAEVMASSKKKWKLLCDAIELNLNNEKLNREVLRNKIKDICTINKDTDREENLSAEINKITSLLTYYLNTDQPIMKKKLLQSRKSVDKLKVVIDDYFNHFQQKEKKEMETNVLDKQIKEEEQCFEEGLDYYDQGEWEKAKEKFLAGLKIAPSHVDLQVHAGLIELYNENHELAYSFFDQAAKLGKEQVDEIIENNPEEYVKWEDRDAWLKKRSCDMKDECPELYDPDGCKDCNEHPLNGFINLYSSLEFRPFFRALDNKSIALIKMKRFKEAIENIKLSLSYNWQAGLSNMIGICYLALGDFKKADKWYTDMLWASAFYMKALIKYLGNNLEECLNYLLTGIAHNWHIAEILIGIEKPDNIRWVGDPLPLDKAASEFFHEHDYVLKKHPGFRTIIKAAYNDEQIKNIIEELTNALNKEKTERNYRMESCLNEIHYGNMQKTWLERHVPRVMASLKNKNGEFWSPNENENLLVKIIEKKKLNWLVSLKQNPEKIFYFRDNHNGNDFQYSDIDTGVMIKVNVLKSWFYKGKLYVSGSVITTC